MNLCVTFLVLLYGSNESVKFIKNPVIDKNLVTEFQVANIKAKMPSLVVAENLLKVF